MPPRSPQRLPACRLLELQLTSGRPMPNLEGRAVLPGSCSGGAPLRPGRDDRMPSPPKIEDRRSKIGRMENDQREGQSEQWDLGLRAGHAAYHRLCGTAKRRMECTSTSGV
mmetsp:Transcript_16821/g.24915  ORF Transcript_16821/g.24915 Transcript_16821/m.24915 type:complete len:111 (-) Transcript_16821:267-599(-)